MTTHHVTIFTTTDLVEQFERSLGYYLTPEDYMEIFRQLFQILDQHRPEELIDRNVLDYNSLVFANHLKVDHVIVDALAHRLMVQLDQRLRVHNFYVNGALMYFPFSMNGKDLCVRRYNN